MKHRKHFCFRILTIFAFLISLLPPLYASDYKQLRKRINQGNIPDSSYLRSLPDPDNPENFWLRSKIQPTLEEALTDLRQAIQNSSRDNVNLYLKDWIRIMLMQYNKNPDFEFLDYHLRRLEDKDIGGEVWLLSARLAMKYDRLELARSWAKEASNYDNIRAEAQLNRVRIALDQDNYSGIETILENYMVQYLREDRPEYWYLKGRFFEETGSDSEAYIAYSHLINNYPKSPLLSNAENRLKNLPLPESLYRKKTSSKKKTKSRMKSSDVGRNETTYENQFRIQVGSFVNRSRAANLRTRLEDQFQKNVFMREAIVKGRKYYRVQVGEFSSRKMASKKLQEIKSSGFEGYITKRDNS